MQIFFELLVHISFSYLATVAFAVCINVPRRALNACGICGMAGWVTYWGLFQLGTGRTLANVAGSLVLGIIGLFFAHYKRMPAILFNIPGIVPLVPGATAYQAVYEMVFGSVNKAVVYTVRVLMVAGAIAIGFMLTSLFSEIWARWRYYRRNLS